MSGPDEKTSDPGVVEKKNGDYDVSPTITQRRPWWKIGGKDISFAPVDKDSVTTSSGSISDDVEGTRTYDIHGSVFSDPDAAQIYKPIEKYEGSHRFDPSATWTPQEEQALVRTVSCPNNTLSVCLRSDLFPIARLENLSASMLHVLRLTTGSNKHLASSL
jgi:hypothetical protein